MAIMKRILGAAALGGAMLFSQQTQFEVAAIRPSPPLTASGVRIGIKVENGRVDIESVTLKGLIMYAFDVKDFQVAGPEPLSERFNIVASMPKGSTKEQAPAMLQALLAERFRMRVHKEPRQRTVYALLQAQPGIKFKAAAPESVEEDQPRVAGVTPTTVKPTASGDSFKGTPNGTLRRTFGPDGIHLEWDATTIGGFAEMLSSILGTTVSDRTGLEGRYQLWFDMRTPDAIQAAKEAAAQSGSTASSGDGGFVAMDAETNAMQGVKALGLRLEKEKVLTDYIVVDHIERTPTEN
jgi:uncharacterized protein (TIGR03435 family)